MKEDLLFYDAYEEFYQMTGDSKAFSEFCKEAFGEDFSQDGFSDIDQVNRILEYIPCDNACILDVGCGNGAMLRYLQKKTGAHIKGFDYSEKAIAIANEYADDHSDYKVGIIDDMEYEDETFDLIVCMDSIYFAEDMAKFVSKVKRWLKPGGVFFVAYQEGDVMPRTNNVDTTVFAMAMNSNSWKYTYSDITEESYNLLVRKREVATKYKDKLIEEGNASWADLLLMQTDYILDGKESYKENLARYIYVAIK